MLALPRGGVPVGFEVAKALRAELGVLLVRKIGAPNNPELGLGALVDGDPPQLVLNDEMVRAVGVRRGFIEREQQLRREEIARRRVAYGVGRPDVEGRTVILVDDGIATGGTVRAALAGLALQHPGRVILAVPVAPVEGLEALRPLCDDAVCLHTPELFRAVGEHYDDFTQTTDEEVVSLLAEARTLGR